VRQDGNTTVLEAFDGFYLGKPKLPGINFSFVGDATTRTLALLNGEADLIERLEAEQVASIEAQEGFAINKAVSVENKYLWFRCSKPPFDNVLLRQAAAHAIDRSVILDVLGVSGHPSNAWISPVKFGYVDTPNYSEYNPEECQRLLAEAGFPNGQGLPELEYITSVGFYPKTKEYGEVITAMLQEQGFPVTLNVMEVAAWNDRLYDRPGGGPGHMIDCGWSTGSPRTRSGAAHAFPFLVQADLRHLGPRSGCGSGQRAQHPGSGRAQGRDPDRGDADAGRQGACPVAVHLGLHSRDAARIAGHVFLSQRDDGCLGCDPVVIRFPVPRRRVRGRDSLAG
jgi:ABC-type transport system substrate-binding protein